MFLKLVVLGLYAGGFDIEYPVSAGDWAIVVDAFVSIQLEVVHARWNGALTTTILHIQTTFVEFLQPWKFIFWCASSLMMEIVNQSIS